MVGCDHSPVTSISRAISAKLISSRSNRCTEPMPGTNRRTAAIAIPMSAYRATSAALRRSGEGPPDTRQW
jgi:hypothetical protein